MLHTPSLEPPSHQTPIKRNKSTIEQGTASSQTKLTPQLQDVDPYQLFHHFEHFVNVTEQTQADEQHQHIERQLHYDPLSPIKLTFQPTSSSMKKKPTAVVEAEVEAIKLFEVQQEERPSQLVLKEEEKGVPSTPYGPRPSLKGVEATPVKQGRCEE